MNENYKQVKKAGYTLEVTTTKYGEGYMHLLKEGVRVIRIHIMTNNRAGKAIMETLPNTRPGSHMDCAMNDLKQIALNQAKRDERHILNTYLDREIDKLFLKTGCSDFWHAAARSTMYRLASQYANSCEIIKEVKDKKHLNKYHEFVYGYLASDQHEFPQNTLDGIASIIKQNLN